MAFDAWTEAGTKWVAGLLWSNRLPRGERRKSRQLRVEQLEARQMLSGTKYLDAVGQIAVHGGNLSYGGGNAVLDLSTPNLYNPATGIDETLSTGDTVVIGGSSGGVITVASGGVTLDALDFNVAGVTVVGGPLTISGSTDSIDVASGVTALISAPLSVGGNFSKTSDGVLQLSSPPTLSDGSDLSLNGNGTIQLVATAGSASVGDSVTATVSDTSTLQLGGSISTLGTSIGHRVHIFNNSAATAGIHVTSGNQVVGAIEGTGNVVIDAGTSLTADSINGGSLVIGAGGTFTLAPSGDLTGPTILDWDPTASGGTALGGSGTWDTTTAQWWNGVADVAWSDPSAIADFGGSSGTVTVSSGIAAHQVELKTTGYTLTGGTLTLDNGNVSVFSGVTGTINSTLDGNHGLDVTGSGVLVVGGANSYTGATYIAGGTLKLANAAALGNSSYVSTATMRGGTLDLNGEAIGSSVPTMFFSGVILNSSSTAASFAAAVNETSYNIALNFTVNAANGDITLSGPVDGYGMASVIKTGSHSLILSGSENNVGLGLAVDQGTVELSKSSSSSVHSVENTITLNGGTVQLAGTGGDQIHNSVINVAGSGAGTLDLAGNNETIYALAGNANLLITGGGVLTLIGASTNSGMTTIDSGTTLQTRRQCSTRQICR